MCMTFKLPVAKDGTVVAARSMEFPMGMPTQLAVLPADHAGTGSVGDGGHPETWTAAHGVVGMGVFGHADWLVDGINTAGVSAHLLYMPGGYLSLIHISEPTRRTPISYAVFCLKKKKNNQIPTNL